MSAPGPARARTPRASASRRSAGRALVAAAAALAGVALAGSAAPAPAQTARAAVLGDSLRVGDVVPVAVRVTLEPGQRIVWPDTLPLAEAEDLENAARVRERVDTLPDGRVQATAVYAVTPWRPGETPLPDLAVQVVARDEGARTLTASLPPLVVASVLPADTVGVQPRPAKGVIGPSWTLWPFILLALALIAAIATLIWWLRRRRRAATVDVAAPAVPPRQRALAALDRAREAGLVERGEMKEFYTRVAAALREYLAAVDPAWSEDLTTTELLAAFRARAGTAAGAGLAQTLRPADQVKFAQRRPDAATALAEWEAARRWIDGFHWPPRTADDVGEAA